MKTKNISKVESLETLVRRLEMQDFELWIFENFAGAKLQTILEAIHEYNKGGK